MQNNEKSVERLVEYRLRLLPSTVNQLRALALDRTRQRGAGFVCWTTLARELLDAEAKEAAK